MVKQGDIIKVNFNPQAGHEQAGYRPALVISNDFFNQKTKNFNKISPKHKAFLMLIKVKKHSNMLTAIHHFKNFLINNLKSTLTEQI